jgi:hypothetical protein
MTTAHLMPTAGRSKPTEDNISGALSGVQQTDKRPK